jgi:acyl-coenzyme A thioesterase PaaI-like protein
LTVNGDEDRLVDPELLKRLAAELPRLIDATDDSRHRAARALGESVRTVIERLTGTGASAEVLDEANAKVAEVAALLSRYQDRRLYEGVAEASGLGHDRAFFDWSPLFGMANPLAPPVYASIEGQAVVGKARFGVAYEGPPGCVHGGFIAAAFDEVLGLTQSLSGKMGMTGTLTVKYRRPTPLYTDLRFEGRVESVRGRKVVTAGTLHAGEVLTAEATGLFVTIGPEQFAALSPQREPFRRSGDA